MATEAAAIRPVEKEELISVAKVPYGAAMLVFTTTPDRMRLFLEAELPEAHLPVPTSRMTLLGLIPKNIPRSLLHPDVLDDIALDLTKGKQPARRRIAKGVAPIAGRDGKIVLLVKTLNRNVKHPEFVDPWFLREFDNVERGMPVARVYPPHPGVLGTDVLGGQLSAQQGNSTTVDVDDTLKQEPPAAGKAYTTVVAQIDGYVRIEKNKLQVVHELAIKGDIDHTTGDIRFVGKVVVRGSVMKNFRVEARDGIEVHGDVLDGVLTSSHGDIVVKGYMSGEASRPLTLREGKSYQQLLRVSHSKPQIVCGKTLKVSVVEGISVEALGNIEVEKASSSSLLRTRGSILGVKAQIIGGEMYSVCGVEAAILGSELETPTRIILCSDRESSAEYAALLDKFHAHESAEEMLKLYLGPYAENPARIVLLNHEHRKKMEGLHAKLEDVKKSKATLLQQKEKLLADAQESTVFRVNFHKAIFPGVTIESGTDKTAIDELITGAKTIEYKPTEKTFEVLEKQEPLQCNLEKKKR